MVSNGRVNIGWQMFFSVLPIVWIWAAYRIEKLRKALLIFIPSSILISLFVPFPLSLISIVIPVYFMWKWSKQWNERWGGTMNLI